MQTSFDSFLVALFVALSPFDQESPPGPHADSFQQGFEQGYERLRLRPDASERDKATDCRYFNDAVARGNCMIRTSRAFAEAGATTLAFPDQIVWIAPGEPGMPFKYNPGAAR